MCYEIFHVIFRNFQLAVARKTLGRVEEKNDISLFEQRQAFSSLRAIRAGKKVGSVRTGHRVRDYYPGTVPQISTSMQNAKPNSKIQIYQVRHTRQYSSTIRNVNVLEIYCITNVN